MRYHKLCCTLSIAFYDTHYPVYALLGYPIRYETYRLPLEHSR